MSSTLPTRTSYPSDVSDEEWTFVVPYLVLLSEDVGQQSYALRDGMRHGIGFHTLRQADCIAMLYCRNAT